MTTNGSAAMAMANGATAMTVVSSPARADLSIRFTQEEERIILETCCGGASKSEAHALISIAEARGLNPILGECYFVKRWDSQSNSNKWAVQASIDSFRIKAEQTGLYAGQDEPEYEYDEKGAVTLARVKVYRKDWPRPAVGVARWSEYVQTTKNGDPTKFWRQMPHNQLAKCAEALALRKAFPAVLSKLYTQEEMAQADNPEPQMTGRATPAQLAPPALITLDEAVFQRLCDQVDEAENAPALNKVASASVKAQKSGAITPAQLEKIKVAVTKKRGLLGTPPPPPPSAPDQDPHNGDEINGMAEAFGDDVGDK